VSCARVNSFASTLMWPGYAIYRTGSSTTLHWFLVASTSFLFLIGAGLVSPHTSADYSWRLCVWSEPN
jgi:high-affinity Fe2+/Pb2+ permease